MPYLVASVTYHSNWLRGTLSTQHPIFTSRLFTDGHVSRLKNKVLLGVGTCEFTGMTATGVPHHLVVSNTVKSLGEKVTFFELSVKRKIEEVEMTIMDKLMSLPSKLTDTMRSNFNIEGAIAVTRQDMVTMFNEMRNEIRDSIADRNANNLNNLVVPQTNPMEAPQQLFLMYHWGGRLHMSPQSFRFPATVSTKSIWDLWHFGNIEQRIQPYRHLRGSWDLNEKNDRTALSKAKKVMDCIEHIARAKELYALTEVIGNCSKLRSDHAFQESFVQLMNNLNRNLVNQRISENSYVYIYELIKADEKAANQH
jgi:hypothetical protein